MNSVKHFASIRANKNEIAHKNCVIRIFEMASIKLYAFSLNRRFLIIRLNGATKWVENFICFHIKIHYIVPILRKPTGSIRTIFWQKYIAEIANLFSG